MDTNGQMDIALIVGAVITLAALGIGLGIVNQTVFPVCHAVGSECTAGNFTNLSYYQLEPNIELNSQVAYNTSNCTGTAMTNGTNYTMNITAGGIRMIGVNYINSSSDKSILYDYYTGSYSGGTQCYALDNFAVFMALGGIVIVGGYLLLR